MGFRRDRLIDRLNKIQETIQDLAKQLDDISESNMKEYDQILLSDLNRAEKALDWACLDLNRYGRREKDD